MKISPAARAAHRGAQYLDKAEPGWTEFVDPSTVNIASIFDCVLAQIGANRYHRWVCFSYMTGRLGLTVRQQVRFGFIPTMSGWGLNWAWRREIRARQRQQRGVTAGLVLMDEVKTHALAA